MARVAMAMSGGVDSSTAAALLVAGGHEVVGLTLQLWDYSEVNLAAGKGRCCSPADIADARAVAARLGFPHYVFDHGATFRDEVIGPFVKAYATGTTPSPCITCNRRVKFDLLWRLAEGLGAELLATGHYARLDVDGPRPRLRMARDRDKDQSYFLFDVPAPRLQGVRFPLGGLTKEEVRDTARSVGLPVADKPESYELCFIPDGDKDGFLDRHMGDMADGAAGPIRHLDGRLLGRHPGLHRFTVGQRRGLGLGGGQRLYVIDIDEGSRTVRVGPQEALYSEDLIAADCNWLAIPRPQAAVRATARIRHRHREVAAEITPLRGGSCHVRFAEPQRAVAPGQGVAFYDGDLLLGGGWIERAAAPELPRAQADPDAGSRSPSSDST